jgi:hypothetical protein
VSPELSTVLLTTGLFTLPIIYTLIAMRLSAWNRPHDKDPQ